VTRRILTAEDLSAMEPGSRLVIDERTTITASAREVARRRDIVLVEGDETTDTLDAGVGVSDTARATAPVRGAARRIIVAAVGVNRAGILAEVTSAVGELGGDILDVSQRITGGYFNAILVVDISRSGHVFAEHRDAMQQLSDASDYVVSVIDERVFQAMHRL
jgi:predicted amino acid-binding ACT domain protein